MFMKKEFIKTQMKVKDNLVNVMRVGEIDYISLTDLARYKNPLTPGDVIIKWMSNKTSFDFYCLWEELFNPKFKLAESREFKNDAATQSFTMSPSRWIKETNYSVTRVKNSEHFNKLFLLKCSKISSFNFRLFFFYNFQK